MSVWDPPATRLGGRVVRPYVMTGGRTGFGAPSIALEAQIATTTHGLAMQHMFKWEAADILSWSREEKGLIELAALIDVPVGVVRVLVADLRSHGAVTISDPPHFERRDSGYTDLLEKVLDGIKSL